MKYTQDQLTKLFQSAVDLFNDTMGEEYHIGDYGILLRFFTPDNGIAVYEDFCSTYFPHHQKENYKHREKFENISAEAFVGDQCNGVMIRADLTFPELELIQIFIHEIAHIYCTHNEIGGENYGYAGYILKLLLPVIVVSFYSMLYGWPVLGAIGKVRQTTISTVIAAVIQVGGIIIIYSLGLFNLVSLALCCGVSEIMLLVIRYGIFIKSKKSFLENS